ncbi:MAG: hypothetical protein IPG53_13270 [Ignavibacteriales bacterium]|nr:hypothetical protein [Ignavibacteriales bacterium]
MALIHGQTLVMLFHEVKQVTEQPVRFSITTQPMMVPHGQELHHRQWYVAQAARYPSMTFNSPTKGGCPLL